MNHINSNKEGTFLNHFGMLDNLEGKERNSFLQQGTTGIVLGDRNQE
jgi:hypothetical protein